MVSSTANNLILLHKKLKNPVKVIRTKTASCLYNTGTHAKKSRRYDIT